MATVAGRQFSYVNRNVNLNNWKSLTSVPSAQCPEVHLTFGTIEPSTAEVAVRLSLEGRDPIVGRAAAGRIGALDVKDLSAGPLAIQVDAEYSSTSVAVNGYLMCLRGSIRS